jgi:hypothetical protein
VQQGLGLRCARGKALLQAANLLEATGITAKRCCNWPTCCVCSPALPLTNPIRLRSLADNQEDVDVKMRLRRVFRSLQGVDDEITRYNAMLAKFLDAKEDEWEAIVAVYRGDLQKAFFEHMQVRTD